jgi:uncharacterized membrane protein
MKMGRQAALIGTLCAASLTMLIIPFADEILRVTLGILTVFFLPGFSATHVAFPARQLSRTDRLLASLGISLAAAVCSAVLLAALPIGLTRDSLSIALGGGTVIASAYALFRTRSGAAHQVNPEN